MTIKQKANLSIEEAIEELRNKPIKSTMLERLHLIEQADKQVQGLPQPLQLGKGLYYILNQASLPVKPHDILLGRVVEHLPNEIEETYIKQYTEKYGNHLRPQWLDDGGHITFSWETLLSNGVAGMLGKAQQALEQHKKNYAVQGKIEFLEGMVWVYRAYQNYIIRYGEEAKVQGHPELSEICQRIAYQPAQTFYEAMQFLLLMGHAYSIYAAVNSTITYGRMDDYLLSYYLHDVNSGILTQEEALCMILDFNCKNNLILGRGEHQMSGDEETDTGWLRNPSYDTPQYVVIGGYSNVNEHNNNPLTRLFAESIVPRFENPVYMFRYTKDVKDDIWEIICDKLRENSSLMIYNDETVIPAMLHAGVTHFDAINYTMHGCNWPDIAGKQAVIEAQEAHIPHRIMRALFNEDQSLRKQYHSLDEIYEKVADDFRQDFKIVAKRYREKVASFSTAVSTILRCTDCFHDGTIDHANSTMNGGVPYPVIYNMVRYIATAADIMSALDTLVFTNNHYSLNEMAQALRENFKGHDDLWLACKKAPKYGCDDDIADNHAKKLMQLFLSITDQERLNENGEIDVFVLHPTITDMNHIPDGKQLMATPDGRLCGAPVSENLSPTAGVGCNSITALLHSVSKLPFQSIHSGAFNLRARKDWIIGTEGINRLKVLLSTYFNMGGLQVQLSVADTKELRDAQLHPELYQDLMVRITGYSAAFVDMSKKAQEEFIRRDEQA